MEFGRYSLNTCLNSCMNVFGFDIYAFTHEQLKNECKTYEHSLTIKISQTHSDTWLNSQ